MPRNRIGRAVITIIFALLIWGSKAASNAFAAIDSDAGRQKEACMLPTNGPTEPFVIVENKWLKSGFDHYGWFDVRRVADKVEFQTYYWDGTAGPLFEDIVSKGFWKYSIIDVDDIDHPLEIGVWEFYDPERCGDKFFVGGKELWRSN